MRTVSPHAPIPTNGQRKSSRSSDPWRIGVGRTVNGDARGSTAPTSSPAVVTAHDVATRAGGHVTRRATGPAVPVRRRCRCPYHARCRRRLIVRRLANRRGPGAAALGRRRRRPGRARTRRALRPGLVERELTETRGGRRDLDDRNWRIRVARSARVRACTYTRSPSLRRLRKGTRSGEMGGGYDRCDLANRCRTLDISLLLR